VSLQAKLSSESRQIILRLVVHAARPGVCILVFVPGIWEITDLQDDFDRISTCATPLQVRSSPALVCLYSRLLWAF
jgi:hypothetical protein